MSQKPKDKTTENAEAFSRHFQSFKSKDTSPAALVRKAQDFEKLVELLIWSEKSDQSFHDVFMEHNLLGLFLALLTACCKTPAQRPQVIKLFRSYSFLITNLKRPELVSYLYSHVTFNNFIRFPFDFKDEELIFYFVNFVKGLSQRFDAFPVQIFYNQVA
jgi:hypothetical protein